MKGTAHDFHTDDSEWLGVPGTGKPVTMQGFVYLHVPHSLETSECRSILNQD